MLSHDVFHSHKLLHGIQVLRREDLEPAQDSPESVLLSDMRAAGAKAFLTADVNEFLVEEVAEEFPASWRLVLTDIQLLGDHV